MNKPTDAEIIALADETRTGEPGREGCTLPISFARASHGQAPAGAGEAAEHYRNAIARACEGWTMPDGLRKHLETALWSPPTPQPTQPQAGAVPLTPEQIQDLLLCGDPTDEEMRLIRIGWDAARGIKGGQHGTE